MISNQCVDSHGPQLVPVLRHFANVQMIGVARLRYRPHTKLTAAWWKDLHTKGEKYRNRPVMAALRSEGVSGW
jgi:hypothetical protein